MQEMFALQGLPNKLSYQSSNCKIATSVGSDKGVLEEIRIYLHMFNLDTLDCDSEPHDD